MRWEPIPDDELRPLDGYLRTGRYLDRHQPKRRGVHRWITDTRRAGAARGGPVVDRVTWCWDCGAERSAAPDVCTHIARSRHEYMFAHNRAHERPAS